MNISTEIIERDISALLQQELQITHKNKTLKEGRLMLFAVKDFYLHFKLQQQLGGKFTLFEIPYPFFYERTSSGILLSYKVNHFLKNDAELKHLSRLYFFNKPSKFYDTDVVITKRHIS